MANKQQHHEFYPGDRVTVTDPGHAYSRYTLFFKRFGFKNKESNPPLPAGTAATVFAKGPSPDGVYTVYGIRSADGAECAIESRGISPAKEKRKTATYSRPACGAESKSKYEITGPITCHHCGVMSDAQQCTPGTPQHEGAKAIHQQVRSAARHCLADINRLAEDIHFPHPYTAQYIIEETIKLLEKQA